MPPPPAPLPPKITPPVQADGVPATTPEAVKPAHAPGKVVAKAFDFASYKKQFSADNARKPKPLMMLITGRRAAGKSSCMGSCPGDLLLFCSRAEHHSFSAAQSIAQMIGNPHAIIPMWIDLDDEERVIDNPERVWTRMADRLDQLIAMPDVASMFPFIAVDSLNSFEKFTLKRDNVLKANQFQKSQEATSNLLELVVDKLLRLRERGCHILVTMAAEVKERADGSMQLTPFLTGYRAAEEVIGSFPDICLAHCVTEVDEEKNEYQERFVFQFRNAEGSKSGKRFSGEVSTSTFNPRLQSIPRPYLPEYADANIGTLIQFINDTFEQMNSSSAT